MRRRPCIFLSRIHFSLALHVGCGDGIAGAMPDAKDANVPLFTRMLKYDAIASPGLAVKQVAGGKAKLLRFSYDQAACRIPAEAVNCCEPTHTPLLGTRPT